MTTGPVDGPFGRLFDETVAPSALLDPAGVLRHVNPAMCAALGREQAELVGQPLAGFLAPDDHHDAHAMMQYLGAGAPEPAPFHRRLVTPSGVRWIRGQISRFPLGPDGWMALLQTQDVTEEMAADERRRSTEATSTASLAALEQGVMLTDAGGNVRMMNPAAVQLLGYTPDELTAVTRDGRWTVQREDGTVLRAHEEPSRRTLRTGRPSHDAIVVWKTKQGTRISVRVGTRAVLDDEGRVSAVVTAFTDVTGERRAESRRRAVEARFEGAFLHAPEGVAIASAVTGSLVAVNPALCGIVGRPEAEILGCRLRDLFHIDAHDRIRTAFDDAIATGSVAELIASVVRADGEVRTVRCRAVPQTSVTDSVDDGVEAVVHLEDITEALRSVERLRATEARFAALIERSHDFTCLLDVEGHIAYASPAGQRMLGFADDMVGRAFASIVHPDDLGRTVEAFGSLLAVPEEVRVIETRMQTAAGGWRHVEIVLMNRLRDPDVRGIVGNVRDVTERAQAASRLRWQAFHDALTGLPNRALLVDRLGHALARSRRVDQRTALLYIDLDRFKAVNDTHGHEFGDGLLVEVGRRLVAAVRADDTVARFGGDEFVVLAESLEDELEATAMASRINETVAAPITVGDTTVQVSASIGVAFDVDRQPQTLLRDADDALYRAKAHGKDRFEVYDDSLRSEARRRIATEQSLRRSLDDDAGVVVHYQPVLDLRTGALASVEALMRMPQAGGGFERPSSFIPIAEETGLIVAMGAGLLDRACGQLSEWRARFGDRAPRQVAVNISARQLANTAFVGEVRRALRQHDLQPSDLIVELTESVIIGADRSTTSSVDLLHTLGVSLVVDDFGTGYSSLAYLTRFPVVGVKLDRAFVDGLGRDRDDTEIVKAVLSLGRSLGLHTVAEGIETAEQLDALRAMGCDQGQGFHLGAPTPPAGLLRFMQPAVASI